MCVIFFLCSGAAFASPFEDTIRILENRTAFHWGRDCFVWLVHYSENLVDPWVEAEAGRLGMSDSERSAYRDNFISDLSIGQAEPVLVTIHAFGARPLNFSPFSDKIDIVTPNGERIKPIRYDRVFDQPLSGVVQGLVFFPKQDVSDFAVAIRGLGVYDERIFSFTDVVALDYAAAAAPKENEVEVVVVELPPALPRVQATAPRQQARREPQAPPPPPPPEPATPPQPVRVPEVHVPTESEIVILEPGKPEPEPDVAYTSREQALRTFLDLWVKLDSQAMYSMLSGSSRKQFSDGKAFEAELRKLPDFRSAIRDGYRIDWLDSERARVVAARRVLFIRTLVSRNLGVAREGATWKIVW